MQNGSVVGGTSYSSMNLNADNFEGEEDDGEDVVKA